jgi:hypothetical protein
MKQNRSTATAEAMYSLDSDYRNWSVIGEEVKWHGSADAKPTDAEIKAEIDRLDAEYDSQEYIRLRQAEYPSLEECIHAILDDGLEELQAKRQAVKQKYKKG